MRILGKLQFRNHLVQLTSVVRELGVVFSLTPSSFFIEVLDLVEIDIRVLIFASSQSSILSCNIIRPVYTARLVARQIFKAQPPILSTWNNE